MELSIQNLLGKYEGDSIIERQDDVTINFKIKKESSEQVYYEFRLSHYTNQGYEIIKFKGKEYEIEGNQLTMKPDITKLKSWENTYKINKEAESENSIFRMEIQGENTDIELIFKDYQLWKARD